MLYVVSIYKRVSIIIFKKRNDFNKRDFFNKVSIKTSAEVFLKLFLENSGYFQSKFGKFPIEI